MELCKAAQLCVFILGVQYLNLGVLMHVFRVRYVAYVLVTSMYEPLTIQSIVTLLPTKKRTIQLFVCLWAHCLHPNKMIIFGLGSAQRNTRPCVSIEG